MSGGVAEGFGHFLNGGHPGPFVLMVLGREVEVGIIGLYAEDLWSFVLIFVEGFDGGDFFKGDFFCGRAIDALLFEGVEVGAGEYHPATFPFL